MSRRSLLCISVLFFLFAFSISPAFATNMGSVLRQGEIHLDDGESGVFNALVWSSDETPYEIEVKVKDQPEGWLVFSQPEKFYVGKDVGSENFVSNSGSVLKAMPIKILVKPQGADPGRYRIYVEARSVSEKDSVSFSQGRGMSMYVVVDGEAEETGDEEPTVEVSVSEPPAAMTSQPEEVKTEETPWMIYAAIIVAIFAVSLAIYRYA